jgi:methionyl-tRNA formyltransferase
MAGLRIAFAGTPGFAVPSLRALLGREGDTVVGVLTQPDRPAGRGRSPRPSPVKEAAEAAGLPVAQPETLRSEAGRRPLEEWQPDLLVVVAYGLILPEAVLALPRLGCLNVHASLLPAYRGAAPIQRALLDGVTETGVSVQHMVAALDAGPVYTARRYAVPAGATAGEVHDALAELGAEALNDTVDALKSGQAEAAPQDEAAASYAPKLEKAEARLDWQRSAAELERAVRAFNPWPVAQVPFGDEVLRLWRVRPAGSSEAAAGTVVGTDPLRVACGDGGVLELEKVQRPGKQAVSGADLARGARLERGAPLAL